MSLHNVGGRYWIFHRTLEPVTEEFVHYFYDADGNKLSATSSSNPIGISNPMLSTPDTVGWIQCSSAVDGTYRLRFYVDGANGWGLYSWDYDLWGYILSLNDLVDKEGADRIAVDMFADIRTIQLYDGVYMDDAGYAFLTANAMSTTDLNFKLPAGIYIFNKNIEVSLPSYLTGFGLSISYRIGETALSGIHFQDDLALLYDGTHYYIGYENAEWRQTLYRLVYIDNDQTLTPNAYFWFTENANPPQVEDVSGTIWKLNDAIDVPAGYGYFDVPSTHSSDGISWKRNDAGGLQYNYAIYIGDTAGRASLVNQDGTITHLGENESKYVRFFNGSDAKLALLIIWLMDNATQQYREPSRAVDLTTLGLPAGKYDFYVIAKAPRYNDSEPSNVLSRTFI